MAVLKEFKEFAVRGSVVDLAVGVIIGAAFGTVVKSLVDDVLMPPVGLLIGGVDFQDFFLVLRDGATQAGPYATIEDAQAAGAVTLNWGRFVNNVITFLIVAWAVFLLVRAINRLHRRPTEPEAPTAKDCPYCRMSIPVQASRCPNCTSQLGGAEVAAAG